MHDFAGLTSASPIGFLAAIGCLRVLAQDRVIDVRLGWRDGHAVLDVVDPDEAINELTENMHERAKALEFTWADTTRKITPERYRKACAQAKSDPRALAFLAGWGTDTVLREGCLAGTRMDMTSGQQKLLRDLRGLAQSVDQSAIKRALLGGPYQPQSSFGLDPVAVRSHAHEHKSPQKSKPPGKPGLVWLAFEAIPLHPVVPITSTRTSTIGWRSGKHASYVWPIWDGFLTLEEVTMLRALPVEKLERRPGVTEIWASDYGSIGKYGMLKPARREQ